MSLQEETKRNICEFCNKSFTNIYNLKAHQKTAKFCLDIQNKPIKEDYECNFCNKTFNLKKIYNNHIFNCKDKKAHEDKEKNETLLKRIKELEYELKLKGKEYESELKLKDKEISKRVNQVSELKVKLSSKDEMIKKLEKTNKELMKRPTNTSIVNNTNNDNRQQNQYNIQFNQLFEKLPILNEVNVNNRINELYTE